MGGKTQEISGVWNVFEPKVHDWLNLNHSKALLSFLTFIFSLEKLCLGCLMA